MGITLIVIISSVLASAMILEMDKNPFCMTGCGSLNTPCKYYPCKIKDKCGSAKMVNITHYHRMKILEMHNEIRINVTNGIAKAYDGFLPRSNDVPLLSYSLQLEFVAQCWANTCNDGEDDCKASPAFQTYLAQNRYVGKPEPVNDLIESTIKYWRRGISRMTEDQVLRYHPIPDTEEVVFQCQTSVMRRHLFFSACTIFLFFPEMKTVEKVENRYCHLSCGHLNTLCKYAPCRIKSQCGDGAHMVEMDQNTRGKVLKLHNAIRKKVSAGDGKLPRAVNMHVLSYSLELEFLAQCWANICADSEDICRVLPNYQTYIAQNRYVGDPEPVNNLINSSIAIWHKSLSLVTYEQVTDYTPIPGTLEIVQMIWADTTHIGCGMVVSDKEGRVICNYAPGGAIEGQPIYDMGEGCNITTCLECGISVPHLCGLSLVETDRDWTAPFTMVGSVMKKDYLLIITCLSLVILLRISKIDIKI